MSAARVELAAQVVREVSVELVAQVDLVALAEPAGQVARVESAALVAPVVGLERVVPKAEAVTKSVTEALHPDPPLLAAARMAAVEAETMRGPAAIAADAAWVAGATAAVVATAAAGVAEDSAVVVAEEDLVAAAVVAVAVEAAAAAVEDVGDEPIR